MTVYVHSYRIEGTASDGQTWVTAGEVNVTGRGNFMDTLDRIMMHNFQKLTRGEAVFGNPGVGCSGPYAITQLLINVREENA